MSLISDAKTDGFNRPNAGPPRMMVSIIIVSWNAQKYLMQCLASLFSERCDYLLEVIVVDNASSDGSPEIVARDYPQVQLIRNKTNLGFAKANNIGVSASTGKYLCLVNSDVKVLPQCLNRLVDYAVTHPDVGMVGPRIIGGDGKLQRSCRGFPTLWNMFCRALALDSLFPGVRVLTGYSLFHWPQNTTRDVDILSGCFWLARRKALDDVGLLDEAFFMYGEDVDWCKRFWKHGWKLAFVSEAEAIHYGGASSANAPVRFFIERHRADLQYWQKHHSRPAVACYFALTCLHLLLRLAGYLVALFFCRSSREKYRYKVNRSVAALKWMLSVGIWQRKASLDSTLPGVASSTEIPFAN